MTVVERIGLVVDNVHWILKLRFNVKVQLIEPTKVELNT